MSELYIEQSIDVVELILNKKDGSGTDTYYLGTDYWLEDELYTSSPEVFPILLEEPQIRRGVGLNSGVRFDVTINIHAHAHFQQYGKSFYDLRNTYEFTGSTIKLRYYAKAVDDPTTNTDSVNVRQFLIGKNVTYDNNGSILRITARDRWIRDKELSVKLDTDDYTSLDDDFDGAYGPICIGTACDTNAPTVDRGDGYVTLFGGFEFTDHDCNDISNIYARNRQQREVKKEWVEIDLSTGSNRNTSGAFWGKDMTLTEDAVYNMRTTARAVVVTPDANYLLAGVAMRAQVQGTPTPAIGKCSCSIYAQTEEVSYAPTPVGAPIWQANTPLTGFTFARQHSFVSESPVILHSGISYMVVFEWSNRDDATNYPEICTKITVGTDHYSQDRTVREAGWTTVTDRELQVELFAFDITSDVTATGSYQVKLAVSSNFGGSNALTPDIPLKVRVEGLKDDGSGTYTGSASSVISNPADVISFVLQEDEFGLGLTSVDTSSLTTTRTALGSDFPINAVINRQTKAQDFLLKICRQARCVIYADNQGQMALHAPSPLAPASLDFELVQSALEGDLEVMSIVENDQGSVINACIQQNTRDTFKTTTDFETITRQVNNGEKFAETIIIDGDSTVPTDSHRQSLASDSQSLYERRERTEALDLFSVDVGDGDAGLRSARYYFDRYHEPLRRVRVRLPRRDYFSTLDLFDQVAVYHSGISDSNGTSNITGIHQDGTPVLVYYDGLPCIVTNYGVIMGEVVELFESGQFIEATIETMLPFEAP